MVYMVKAHGFKDPSSEYIVLCFALNAICRNDNEMNFHNCQFVFAKRSQLNWTYEWFK